MSKTRNNHYVPQWYQEGFFEPGRSSLAYLDMTPDRKVLPDGRVIDIQCKRVENFGPAKVKAAIAASLAERVWPALAAGQIRRPYLQYFPLEDAFHGHKAMERREHFGKIVLVTPFGAPLLPKSA